jgi:hypothetical protein
MTPPAATGHAAAHSSNTPRQAFAPAAGTVGNTAASNIRAKIDARDGLCPQSGCSDSSEVAPMRRIDNHGILSRHDSGQWSPGPSPTPPGLRFGEIPKQSSPTSSKNQATLNWADEFHVWRMDWNENKISLYVDTICLNEVDINEATGADGFNPFRQPHICS